MNAMLVGADRLGNIPQILSELGIQVRHHVSGRVPAHQKTGAALPKNLDLLILFTDFLNHNAMRTYRSRAQAQGIRVIACRRSASCLVATLGMQVGDWACADCPQRPQAKV